MGKMINSPHNTAESECEADSRFKGVPFEKGPELLIGRLNL